MAASETNLSSWKTPFSTPIRKNENTCRDIFHNSEKLLASAVSICRLKGSVECQTGGVITVCEELQRLIRLAFSEVKHLEEHFDSQRSSFEDEIACLKERVKHLEEVDGCNKENGSNNNCEETAENPLFRSKSVLRGNDGNTEDSDPNPFESGSTDGKDVSVIGALNKPPEQQASKFPKEAKKGNLKKCSKKLPFKKTGSSSDEADEVESSHNQNLPSKIAKKMENEDVVAKEKSEAVILECKVKLKNIFEKDRKKKGFRSKALLENSIKESEDSTSNVNHLADSKNVKKGKKKSPVGKDESEVFQAESSGEVIFPAAARKKSKGKKSKPSPLQEKSQKKKLSSTKKSKSGYDDMAPEPGEDEMEGKSEAKEESSQKEPEIFTIHEMTSSNEKSSEREFWTREDKDEPLGDMSFLININSQISMFVADASQQECELQPMTARERNDVYKVTQLYKVRARIGTKTENNLTTVRLSKQAETRMPKPGRVDSLLSNLSIMACKEATRESPKNQGKRKHTSPIDRSMQSTAEDHLEQATPPKMKLTELSKANY